jgi:tRNA pseudouridine55 synthase
MKRRGERLDGFLILDKPVGPSSTQAMAKARRALGAAKAGHCGTLDPLASGVLVIAFGEATKLVAIAMDGRKRYRFTVTWGEARTTDDAEGEVIARNDLRPMREAILAVLPSFIGRISQRPPDFSAIKLEGRPAYARIRAGEEVAPAMREVVIHELALVDIPDRDRAVLEVACGKGTYVRALARDLAQALGTFGFVSELRRLSSGAFTLEQAISLESLERQGYSARAHLQPVETVLDDIPALAVTGDEAERITRGQAVQMPRAANGLPALPAGPDRVVAILCAGRLIALGRIEDGTLRATRVINPQPQET